MTEWISVKDELPPKHEWVLVARKDGIGNDSCLIPEIAERRRCDNLWHFMTYDREPWLGRDVERELSFRVTHWMPPPAAERIQRSTLES